MNKQNLKRVFIHEIGHFIARELNHLYYKIGLGTGEIFIEVHEFQNFTEYTGATTAIKPEGYVENGEVENVTEYMAVILYGCILQTLYLKSIDSYDFSLCFKISDGANGKRDVEEFSAMGIYFTGLKRKKIVEFASTEYLNKLFLDQTHLKKVFELDPLKFIENKNGKFIVNIELLRKDLSVFMVEHQEYYSYFINNIERIKNEN